MRLSVKKVLVCFSVVLMVTSGFALMLPEPVVPEKAERTTPMVLNVGTDGGYNSIRAALNEAIDGDTIELAPGVYDEFINIDKSIWLRGAEPQSLPSDLPDDEVQLLTGGHIMMTQGIMVTADNARVSSMTIRGVVTVPNGRDVNNPDWRAFPWNSAGIITMAWGNNGIVDDLRVDGVTFENCWQGIFLFGAQTATVNNCVFRDCYRGITIRDHYLKPDFSWTSSNNRIQNCKFYDSYFDHPDLTEEEKAVQDGDAISIQSSDNNDVFDCTMDGNTYGVTIYRGTGNEILRNTITNTTQHPIYVREVTESIQVNDNTIIESDKNVLFYKCANFNFNRNKLDGATLELLNSTKGIIRDNDWEQTDTPALAFGTEDKHYDHEIGQSNNIGGKAIYYYYDDDLFSLSDVDAGAVYVMACEGGILDDMKVIGGDGIVVHKSDNTTIGNVKVTNNLFGVDVADSKNLRMVGTDVDTGGRGRFGVRLHNITNSTFDDGDVTTYGAEHSIRLTGGTDCGIHNTTFDGDNVQVTWNDGGVLEVSNNLRVRIMDNGSVSPYQGGHVLITEDSEPVYSTRYFGGDDTTTGEDGIIGPISLVDRVYYNSNLPIESYHSVQVFAEVDGMWTESRPNLDMSYSRTENFEIDDIWAPGSPINVRLKDLPEEDAIEITWFPPLDGDTQSVSIYSNMTGEWKEVVRYPETATYHKITSGLVHGTNYYFRLTAWDDEGLESLPTPEFGIVHIDGVTPPAPANLMASNVTAFSCQLDWDAVPDEDLVGYHVYINDTGVGPSGPWIKATPTNGVSSNLYQVTGLTSETTYFFAVSAFDEVPNESPHSPTIKVETPDVTPPTRPLLDALPAYTNEKDQTVSGLAEADVTVAIFIGGEEVGSTVADAEKVFALDVTLTEGANVISAQATDASGNKGMFSREITVVLDTTVPDAPLLDPLPEITREVNLLVTGVAEGGSTVTLFVDDIEQTSAESIMYVGFSAHVTLTEGLNAICAQATDRALNVGPKCTEVEVILDTVPPLEPELDPLPAITNDPALTVTGVAEPDSTVEVYLEDYMAGTATADGGGRFSVDIELLEGTNFLMVRCIDLALNPSRATLPTEVLLDTIPPVAYLGEDMEIVEGVETTFDGSTSYDNQGITDYLWTFEVDGTEETMTGDVFKYTFDHPMEVLMTLIVTDVAGNEGSSSITLTVISSNRAPTMTLGMVDPPEGHSETEFTFQVTLWDEDGHLGTVNLVLDSKIITMSPDSSDSDATDGVVYTHKTDLGKGDHTYYFTGEDPFGLEATGPCVGSGNARTMTVYEMSKSATPGAEAIMAVTAIALLGAAAVVLRRREVVR
ncbi:MAG: right-handed parallel beta-helix repeat-containing protein [Thermoplasmata archaeon]|nr:MAG: right-handed parallel beta-helix repeat-containing protein [Thermoplasmata archaeon]